MQKEENKKEFDCEINKYGELRLDNKKYIVAITDIKQEIEFGRIRHKFILTEII